MTRKEETLAVMPDKVPAIGRNIREIRRKSGLSQANFGEIFGLWQPAISAIEVGLHEPKMELVISIAKHFKLSIDEIITEE